VAFGLTVGLLYDASLFYSMDVGEARAEQIGFEGAALLARLLAGDSPQM
jgi:hypothetical protein